MQIDLSKATDRMERFINKHEPTVEDVKYWQETICAKILDVEKRDIWQHSKDLQRGSHNGWYISADDAITDWESFFPETQFFTEAVFESRFHDNENQREKVSITVVVTMLAKITDNKGKVIKHYASQGIGSEVFMKGKSADRVAEKARTYAQKDCLSNWNRYGRGLSKRGGGNELKTLVPNRDAHNSELVSAGLTPQTEKPKPQNTSPKPEPKAEATAQPQEPKPTVPAQETKPAPTQDTSGEVSFDDILSDW